MYVCPTAANHLHFVVHQTTEARYVVDAAGEVLKVISERNTIREDCTRCAVCGRFASWLPNATQEVAC